MCKHSGIWSKLFKVLSNLHCWNEFLKLLTSYKSTSHNFTSFSFCFAFVRSSPMKPFAFEVRFFDQTSSDNELLIANNQRKIPFQCNGNHFRWNWPKRVQCQSSFKSFDTRECERGRADAVTHIFECWTSIFDRITKQTSALTLRVCVLVAQQ